MSKIIYIGSPYSHTDPKKVQRNFELVSKLAAEICSQGDVAFSPITYGHTLLGFKKMPSDWGFWKNFCLSFLKKSDKLLVYMMEGWENSSGLGEELVYARELGIEIEYKIFEEPGIKVDEEFEKNVSNKI
jgi:hypothetical protein